MNEKLYSFKYFGWDSDFGMLSFESLEQAEEKAAELRETGCGVSEIQGYTKEHRSSEEDFDNL